jgi:hypothetical protein
MCGVILRELKQYMIEHNTVALIDLVNHFSTDSTVIEKMLDRWIKKDRIEVIDNKKGCGTICCKCDERLIKFYKWK